MEQLSIKQNNFIIIIIIIAQASAGTWSGKSG
jgi:hypothetical protein